MIFTLIRFTLQHHSDMYKNSQSINYKKDKQNEKNIYMIKYIKILNFAVWFK